ncbi:hypothetical protein [Brevibacillus borstelensis]|uniref:hypothetical protein n=1 Tax=Brevibacillus borstelensis TaxID=45462 RepID=UPI0030C38CF4
MALDLIVIDNFYDKPDDVRSFAINRKDYLKKGLRFETQKLYYTDTLIKRFEEILGISIQVDPIRYGFGTFNYFPEGDDLHHSTHYDDAEWVGLIYLTPNEMVGNGGLSLCRHKESGLMGPPNKEWLSKNGFESFEQWVEQVYKPNKTNVDAWETTMFIPTRYNRLILKRGGKMFHRGGKGFGKSVTDSRLLQRFFFEEIK